VKLRFGEVVASCDGAACKLPTDLDKMPRIRSLTPELLVRLSRLGRDTAGNSLPVKVAEVASTSAILLEA
jgi:hypothetical protein